MKQSHLYDDTNLRIAGKVGQQEIPVEDFNQVKCPFCGSNLILHAFDMSDEQVSRSLSVNCTDAWSDDIGQNHVRHFGRTRVDSTQKDHLTCPNKCIENMIVPVTNTTYGMYRELTEIE